MDEWTQLCELDSFEGRVGRPRSQKDRISFFEILSKRSKESFAAFIDHKFNAKGETETFLTE